MYPRRHQRGLLSRDWLENSKEMGSSSGSVHALHTAIHWAWCVYSESVIS